MKEFETINPWQTIWGEPTLSMNYIVTQKKTLGLWLLCILSGLHTIVALKVFHWIAFLMAPLIGYVTTSLAAWCIKVTGKILKGQGEFWQIRASTLWANLPVVASTFLALALTTFLSLKLPSLLTMLLMAITLLSSIAATAWATCLSIFTLKTVQKFKSPWIAFGNLLLGGIFFMVIYLVIFSLFHVMAPQTCEQFISHISSITQPQLTL